MERVQNRDVWRSRNVRKYRSGRMLAKDVDGKTSKLRSPGNDTANREMKTPREQIVKLPDESPRLTDREITALLFSSNHLPTPIREATKSLVKRRTNLRSRCNDGVTAGTTTPTPFIDRRHALIDAMY